MYKYKINEEYSQDSCTNQSIIFCDMDVIDKDKETESECFHTTTITFLTICEFPIPEKVVLQEIKIISQSFPTLLDPASSHLIF